MSKLLTSVTRPILHEAVRQQYLARNISGDEFFKLISIVDFSAEIPDPIRDQLFYGVDFRQVYDPPACKTIVLQLARNLNKFEKKYQITAGFRK